MDEMDMIFMQSSTDKDTDLRSPRNKSFSESPGQSFQPLDRGGNPLKFHLITTEGHGGYLMSLSHRRVCHLRRVLEDNKLLNLDSETVCNLFLSKAKASRLSKSDFDSAMNKLLKQQGRKGKRETAGILSGLLSNIFDAFDREGNGTANAIEIACGFTVLCNGKKSDKLEFAFEVLDKKKRGKLSRSDISSYLRSFLTVLLGIAFSSSLKNDRDDSITTMKGVECHQSTTTIIKAVNSGAHWAASASFEGKSGGDKAVMSFDDFADWYTAVGYSSIPWLELLDLQKWVFTVDTA
jgi:hypothetical protein